MLLNTMEVLEEVDPLQIDYESQLKYVSKFKNSVGRPKENSVIKFSPQPNSVISILLKKQRTTNVLINELIKKSESKVNEPIHEKSSEGALYSKSDCNKKDAILQKDKLYECNHGNCTYWTKFPSNLKTHKRIHTSEQPYVCDECTFRSKFISSLKTHKRLHRNERPFVCQFCVYRCNSHSNLKKHISRRHAEINNDK